MNNFERLIDGENGLCSFNEQQIMEASGRRAKLVIGHQFVYLFIDGKHKWRTHIDDFDGVFAVRNDAEVMKTHR